MSGHAAHGRVRLLPQLAGERGSKAFIDALNAHPPAGFWASGNGSGDTSGGFDEWSVFLNLRHHPGGVYQEGVTVDATVAKAGGMTARVDSWALSLSALAAGQQDLAGRHLHLRGHRRN
jgi:hypothetical protein